MGSHGVPGAASGVGQGHGEMGCGDLEGDPGDAWLCCATHGTPTHATPPMGCPPMSGNPWDAHPCHATHGMPTHLCHTTHGTPIHTMTPIRHPPTLCHPQDTHLCHTTLGHPPLPCHPQDTHSCHATHRTPTHGTQALQDTPQPPQHPLGHRRPGARRQGSRAGRQRQAAAGSGRQRRQAGRAGWHRVPGGDKQLLGTGAPPGVPCQPGLSLRCTSIPTRGLMGQHRQQRGGLTSHMMSHVMPLRHAHIMTLRGQRVMPGTVWDPTRHPAWPAVSLAST